MKSWVEMNVLYIVDQDHQRWVIQEDHTTSKCKAIKSIVNPLYKVYNTENGASLQKLSDESQISGKS